MVWVGYVLGDPTRRAGAGPSVRSRDDTCYVAKSTYTNESVDRSVRGDASGRTRRAGPRVGPRSATGWSVVPGTRGDQFRTRDKLVRRFHF